MSGSTAWLSHSAAPRLTSIMTRRFSGVGAARKGARRETIPLTPGAVPGVSIPCVRYRDRAKVPGGTPANHLDQTTIAHLPGHKTAKAISASNADAESK